MDIERQHLHLDCSRGHPFLRLCSLWDPTLCHCSWLHPEQWNHCLDQIWNLHVLQMAVQLWVNLWTERERKVRPWTGEFFLEKTMLLCLLIITLTSGVVAKLSAHYGSIFAIPAVITDGSPAPIKTHLHSSLILVGTILKADCPSGTVGSDIWAVQINKWRNIVNTHSRLCTYTSTIS